MSKIVKSALWSGAIVAVAAAIGGGYYAWDRGIIPGNPRAPVAGQMLPVLRNLHALNARERTLCVAPEASPPPEIQGVAGMAPRLVPGQHRAVYLLQTAPREQEMRDRQLQQLNYLAKHGLFAATDTEIETDIGRQPARDYRLTWDGFKSLASYGSGAPCFVVGMRGLGAVTHIERLPEEALGLQVWHVTYEMVLANAPAWAANPEAARLFPPLRKMLEPTTQGVKLLRGGNGWASQFEVQAELAAASGGSAYLEELKALAKQPPPDLTLAAVKTALDDYLSSDAAGRNAVACLPLRMQKGGDDKEAAKDRAAYTVSYYDAPGRRDYERTALLTVLQVLSALEAAGLATREEASPGVVNNVSFDTGVRFRLRPDVVRALGLENYGAGCVPAGKMTVEVLSVSLTGDRSALFAARGQLAQVPDWVQKVAANLPALKSMLDNGLPFSGSMAYASETRIAGSGPRRWMVGGLASAFPEIAATTLPPSLQRAFPVTVAEARKPTVTGWDPNLGLPPGAPGTAYRPAPTAPALAPKQN